ncbi:MAG: hypothetical protein ABW138_22450, partial [Candidatus Thiodiazotropha sp. 4PDIVS1]
VGWGLPHQLLDVQEEVYEQLPVKTLSRKDARLDVNTGLKKWDPFRTLVGMLWIDGIREAYLLLTRRLSTILELFCIFHTVGKATT